MPEKDAADDEITKTYTNYRYDTAAGNFMWPVSVLTGDGVGNDVGEGGGVTYNLQNLADNTFEFSSKLSKSEWGGAVNWKAV